jgi:hypothetical protein
MAHRVPARSARISLPAWASQNQIEADFDGYDVEVPGIERSVHVPAIDVVLGCI